MVISSRTPEGDPAECPVCGGFVLAESSAFYSDAPCPACGSLLWFLRLASHNVLVHPADAVRRKGLIKTLSDLTGLSESELREDPEAVARLEMDSLDLVELAAELEDGY